MFLISAVSAKFASDRFRRGPDIAFHAIEHGRIGIAHVDHEEDFSRHHVGRSGFDFQQADGADRGGKAARAGVDGFDDARGAEQGIVAARHRRRAGMGVLPDDRRLVPAHGLHAGDDADVFALGFEIGALLDMHLEESRQSVIAAALRSAIADLVQRVAECFAAAVGARAAQSRVNTPANTPDAIMAGAKRAPSSLVQLTTSIGAKVS